MKGQFPVFSIFIFEIYDFNISIIDLKIVLEIANLSS